MIFDQMVRKGEKTSPVSCICNNYVLWHRGGIKKGHASHDECSQKLKLYN